MGRNLKVILNDEDAALLEELQELTGQKQASYAIREIIRNHNRLLNDYNSTVKELRKLREEHKEMCYKVAELVDSLQSLSTIKEVVPLLKKKKQ